MYFENGMAETTICISDVIVVDLDGDGDITAADSILLLQYLAGYEVELGA